MRHVGTGTGAALKMAEGGQFDLVLAHAKALEEKFVQGGFGTQRVPLMFNDFVIAGPAADPAGLKGMKTAAMQFMEWMTAPEKGQTIIRDFGKDRYGAPMFFPNSDAWRKSQGK